MHGEKSKAPMVEETPLAIGSASQARSESESNPTPLVARKVELPMFDVDLKRGAILHSSDDKAHRSRHSSLG